jgi:hypothetical protein
VTVVELICMWFNSTHVCQYVGLNFISFLWSVCIWLLQQVNTTHHRFDFIGLSETSVKVYSSLRNLGRGSFFTKFWCFHQDGCCKFNSQPFPLKVWPLNSHFHSGGHGLLRLFDGESNCLIGKISKFEQDGCSMSYICSIGLNFWYDELTCIPEGTKYRDFQYNLYIWYSVHYDNGSKW